MRAEATSPAMQHAKPARAFTLIEMLVVVAVIALLMGIALPSMRMVMRETQNSQCLANLRQNFVAIDAYSQSNRETLPMCEFLPVVTDNGPDGGLPLLLRGYMDPLSDSWKCPCDVHEDSLSTGTSYLYVPGLLRYTPTVQAEVAVLLSSFPPGSMTPLQLQRIRLDTEGKLMTTFYRADGSKFPLLVDSEDRHPRTGTPRNGVFIDGSARIADAPPEEDGGGGGGGGSP
ncbi:MAG: prepilin-type N-terminal cleavage/methylation domain-containing protein [Phycisphaerae bacterium]|nr:prepilin-type N-terminal cleavage/methylation domain-containing protein [Phycisphaerae bacterium]